MGNCQLGCFAGDFVRVSASCDVEQDSPGKSAAPDANSFNFIIILLVASLGRPVGAIQDILACSSKQPERLFIIILLVASLGRPVRSYSGHHPGMQQQTSREVACRVQRHNEHALPNGAFTHEAHCQHETLMYI